MDFTQFSTGLLECLFVPDAQRQRSLAVAKVLSDADRLEFLRHLQEMDRELRQTEEERGDFLEHAERVVVRVEHAMARLGREGEEHAEREQEMKNMEAQLSPPPHVS
ncbi:MAG: hypothetical protein WCV62_02715 [Candidatus Peribacteraceae bacterium]|jgi:hypothetical protein